MCVCARAMHSTINKYTHIKSSLLNDVRTRANDTPHMRKLSFINIMYIISSKSGYIPLAILINMSMHIAYMCVRCDESPHHRFTLHLCIHIYIYAILQCCEQCSLNTLKYITTYFHILLRVIWNDVSDRLSRCLYLHCSLCIHVWFRCLAFVFASGHCTPMTNVPSTLFTLCGFSIQEFYYALPLNIAHNWIHPILSSFFHTFDSFHCTIVLFKYTIFC